jgi:hypothetical protein
MVIQMDQIMFLFIFIAKIDKFLEITSLNDHPSIKASVTALRASILARLQEVGWESK